MKKSSENLLKAIVSSLVGALLVCGAAQAQPRPFSKTLTFTQTVSTPAPSGRWYAPAATKYSPVRPTRARNAVAMETLDLAHEQTANRPPNRARPEAITIPVERFLIQ